MANSHPYLECLVKLSFVYWLSRFVWKKRIFCIGKTGKKIQFPIKTTSLENFAEFWNFKFDCQNSLCQSNKWAGSLWLNILRAKVSGPKKWICSCEITYQNAKYEIDLLFKKNQLWM